MVKSSTLRGVVGCGAAVTAGAALALGAADALTLAVTAAAELGGLGAGGSVLVWQAAAKRARAQD